MATSFNSANKVFIRKNWNKPLLEFLSKITGDKLVYLGLPSPEAEDILEWIKYIKVVVAFQCRDYKTKSSTSQNRQAIEDLQRLLSKLEREKQIDTYTVFDGWLEEVVLRGYDNSPIRIDLNLSDFITLYNLDFCNSITSRIEFKDQSGAPQIAYKFDAINKLLQIQKSLSKISNKFVLFITLHYEYAEREIENFINHPPSEEINLYIQGYRNLKGVEQNVRIVKLFFSYYIKQQFEVYGFSSVILPCILYNGLGGTNLLHFSVLGIHPTNSTAGTVPTFQSQTEILNQNFISIKNSSFINKETKLPNETDVLLDPVDVFTKSSTYNNLWV